MPSTVIRAFAYDPAARRLVVGFVTGRRYAYRDVPPQLVERFRAAFSRGRFFNARIRDAFACEELEPEPGETPAAEPALADLLGRSLSAAQDASASSPKGSRRARAR